MERGIFRSEYLRFKFIVCKIGKNKCSVCFLVLLSWHCLLDPCSKKIRIGYMEGKYRGDVPLYIPEVSLFADYSFYNSSTIARYLNRVEGIKI